ncbi:hypothetical protein GGH99_002602 [Coemansia sp. RSA 1285]|nr:hypothetical protein GGH99_002602 [Coemansia sp. RSA 1285]
MMETTKKKKKKTASSDKSANFLKRIHDTPPAAAAEGEGEQDSQGPKAPQYYQAAAEDDRLGWAIGDDRVDPMYTMRRREQEQGVRGKDAFFKRLKTGGAAAVAEDTPQRKGPGEADPRSPAAPVGLVAFGGVAFGFGMGGGASMKPGSENPDGSGSSKQKEKKKKEKKKEEKVKEKKEKRAS